MLAILGWNPDAPHKKRVEPAFDSRVTIGAHRDEFHDVQWLTLDRIRGHDRRHRRQQARLHRRRAARRRRHGLDGHHDRDRGRPARRLERDGDPGRHLDHRGLFRQDRRAELALGAIVAGYPADGPGLLIMVLSMLTGILSMFIDNVVCILMMAPVALPLARALEIPATPLVLMIGF